MKAMIIRVVRIGGALLQGMGTWHKYLDDI